MSSAWCVTCSKRVTPNNVQRVTMKNGRPAERGTCPCGTTTNKIVKADG